MAAAPLLLRAYILSSISRRVEQVSDDDGAIVAFIRQQKNEDGEMILQIAKTAIESNVCSVLAEKGVPV